MSHAKRILLTGATGYVGGRLLSLLQQHAHPVRCLVRRPECLELRKDQRTEIVGGDVLDSATLTTLFQDVDTAYYLIHSMGSTGDFAQQDRLAAENFSKAAAAAGVRRIIYLGGLGNPDLKLSKHLSSRQETGDILRLHHPHVIEFRASIVIGSGSLSFEMIRSLVERLPVMICPKWVEVKAQPIAIEDLLAYLLAGIDIPCESSQVYEIGGPDRVSYGDIMREYAKQRGLRRWMISVPLLTPYLSSLWLGLVTPLYARVGRKMVDSMRNATLLSNNLAARAFKMKTRSMSEAIQRALINEDRELAETRWSDALSAAGDTQHWGGTRFGSRLVDARSIKVDVPPAQAFAPIRRIGGQNGWYYGNWMWSLRGFIDLLFGGIGVRRGRRDPESLQIGDPVDFWRVEAYEAPRRLRLRAEMKLPGRAWLEFEVVPDGTGCVVQQTAIFDPVGLSGIAYWYSVYPIHQFVFAGMLRNIARAAASSSVAGRGEPGSPIPPDTARAGTQLPVVSTATRPTDHLLHFVQETSIDASPETVFEFHESPDALTLLIPPWENMRVVESPHSLEIGSRVVLEGRLGPFRLRWVAEHTEYQPPHLFEDRQVSGPFAIWVHRHEFLPDGQGGTLLRDSVRYLPPLGWFGRVLGGWWIRRKLKSMFAYRHEVTRRHTSRSFPGNVKAAS